jgi:hypothetical protein
MSDKEPKYVPYELVGGPHDGQVHYCSPGVLTICIPYGVQVFTYVRGKDNRLHHTPMANDKLKKRLD